MTLGLKTIIYPVKDIAKAKAFYRSLLGAEPSVDQPYYVGFNVGDQHVGLVSDGRKEGAVGYWHVADIRKSLNALLGGGAEALQDVKEVGVGRLVASAKDSDGNVIGLIQDS